LQLRQVGKQLRREAGQLVLEKVPASHGSPPSPSHPSLHIRGNRHSRTRKPRPKHTNLHNPSATLTPSQQPTHISSVGSGPRRARTSASGRGKTAPLKFHCRCRLHCRR
jgi:hypothetical protein